MLGLLSLILFIMLTCVYYCFKDLHGQFYENTVVVQYDKDLLEVWDEAKRLRCEWFNDYEKTASKPPMVIADLDVIQLDFRGDFYLL